MLLIHEGMIELEEKGVRVNRKNLITHLKGILERDKITYLLENEEDTNIPEVIR